MTKIIVYLTVTVLGLLNSGCGKASSDTPALVAVPSPTATPQASATPLPAASPTATPTSSPSPIPSATPLPTATPISLTYYSRNYSLGPPGGETTVTGSCVNYGSNTYCWDGGEVLITSELDVYCSYFGVTSMVGNCTFSSSNIDLMAQPTVVSINLLNDMVGHAFLTPTQVLATGTPKQNSCSLSGSNLVCTDFTINLAQVPL